MKKEKYKILIDKNEEKEVMSAIPSFALKLNNVITKMIAEKKRKLNNK